MSLSGFTVASTVKAHDELNFKFNLKVRTLG